jgi:O-antigen ligase
LPTSDTIDAMTSFAVVQAFERQRLSRIADILAALLAAALPWSTSAAGIVAAVYALVLLSTLNADSVRSVRAVPALWLPLALAGLGVLGLMWSEASWSERWTGLSPMAKLLVLPLVMLHFRESERASWVIAAFLASCTVLLAASMVPLAAPPLQWMWAKNYAVPVKDRIVQSGEFLICLFVALYLSVERVRAGRYLSAAALLVLTLLFAANILFVAAARTALAALPVLLLLFGLWMFRWRGVVGAVLLGMVVAAAAWVSSPYLRERTTRVISEVQRYQADNAETSIGFRLEFWRKSLHFIADAPLLGHGTGSIESQFRKAATGATGLSSEVTANPHNQTLIVGVQLGMIGIAVLWAMWIAHLLLFRRDGLVAWFGLLVTVQTMVGSLFNSLLSDFTTGWIYVLCVGAAGGAMLRAHAPSIVRPRASGDPADM